MDVSENNATSKSSILIRVSIINHPFWGTSIFGNIHIKKITHDERPARSRTAYLILGPFGIVCHVLRKLRCLGGLISGRWRRWIRDVGYDVGWKPSILLIYWLDILGIQPPEVLSEPRKKNLGSLTFHEIYCTG